VAAVAGGASVLGTSKRFGVSPATIRRWRSDAGLSPTAGDQQTQTDYAALVLRHLELGLAAAERILEQTQDKGWLGEQSAGELATLYGVIFDKQARILSALPAGAGREAEDGGEPPALPSGDAPGGADPHS
jgi:transposase-like protein